MIAAAIPFILLAAITTTLAFFTLFVRVLIIYTELAVVLMKTHSVIPLKSNCAAVRQDSTPSHKDGKESYRKSRRSSFASSHSNGGSLTPKFLESNALRAFSGIGIDRDFEGVGGWKDQGSRDDDDCSWASMNSRLELPAISTARHHRRSLTFGSVGSTPWTTRYAVPFGARTPGKPNSADMTSVEGYFSNHAALGLMTPNGAPATDEAISDGRRSSMSSRPSSYSGSFHLRLGSTNA